MDPFVGPKGVDKIKGESTESARKILEAIFVTSHQSAVNFFLKFKI